MAGQEFHALTYHLLRYEGHKYFEGEGEVGMLARNLRTKETVIWEYVTNIFGGATKVTLETIANDHPDLASRVRNALGDEESAGKIVKSTTMKTDEVYFPVILHGDLWTNNILFKYGPDGSPAEVKFVDFQQARRGNIFEDLQYFLFTSTTPAARRQFLSQWLETYYLGFTGTLARLKCPNPANFTRGFLTGEMWNCFLSGYAYMFFAIPFQLGIFTPLEGEVEVEPPHRLPSDQPPTADEISASLHANFTVWMRRSPAARNRLLDITREFVDYGLI